jgi:alpha-glucosidase (family GH31 glycosyl hydrolase)
MDFFLFTGPTPEDVTRQYTHYFGRSYIFPYWSMGFQLCRNGLIFLDATSSDFSKYNDKYSVRCFFGNNRKFKKIFDATLISRVFKK